MMQDEIDVINTKNDIDKIAELMDLMELYIRVNFYNNIHDYIDRKKIDEGGISRTEHYILYYLYKTEAPSPVKKLTKRLMFNNMSRHINMLEDAGYVERNLGKKDKRTILVSLSEKGKAFMDEYYFQYNEAAREFMSEVYTDEQRKFLKDNLINIITLLKQTPEKITQAEKIILEMGNKTEDLSSDIKTE